MDIGRFVRSFEAFDAAGRPVPVERVSVNQWRLGDPARVRTMRYAVAETWDTPVEQHPIYLMCGTSIERDHVLINPHAVIGYPTGMQARPIRLRLEVSGAAGRWEPRSSATGRRLPGGGLRPAGGLADPARPPDRGADPSHRRAGGDLHLLARPARSRSAQLLAAMDGMLQAAGRFLGKLPVDRYTFLYHFDEQARRRLGAFAQLRVRAPGEASSPIRSAATSPTSRRTSSSTS